MYFYADDVVLYGKDLEHGLWLLDQVLSHLCRDRFVVAARKCHFFYPEMEVLGQVVGVEEMSIPSEKVQTIVDFPIPRTKKAMQ